MSDNDPTRRYVVAVEVKTGAVVSWSHLNGLQAALREAGKYDHDYPRPRYVVRLVPVLAYAEHKYDAETGAMLADFATCGSCGRMWNDADVTGWTPAPSARCPFEYDHDDDADNAVTE